MLILRTKEESAAWHDRIEEIIEDSTGVICNVTTSDKDFITKLLQKVLDSGNVHYCPIVVVDEKQSLTPSEMKAWQKLGASVLRSNFEETVDDLKGAQEVAEAWAKRIPSLLASITSKEAATLKKGDIVYHRFKTNADGTPQKWRVVKDNTPLAGPIYGNIRVHVKRGIREFDTMDNLNFHKYSRNG